MHLLKRCDSEQLTATVGTKNAENINKSASKTDKLVGRNIRVHRLVRGLTQEGLGEKLGVTFQQIQKYEKGTNRVGSGRLYQIATIF